MRSMRRYLCLALVLVFALAFMLTGCGTQTTEQTGTAAPAATQAAAATTAPAAPASTVPKDNVKLTWYVVGNRQEPDADLVMSKVNDYLKDKLNITLDYETIAWGDAYDQKVNTMLSSGQPFDLCFTANWAANYYMNAASGYFLQLNDPSNNLIKKYPGVEQTLGSDFLGGAAIDGKIYGVPCNKEKVHNWGYLIQKKYIDKYNIDVSSIKTMEDMEPWFDKIKANEPGITPLLVVGGDSPFHFLDWDNMSDDTVPGALYPDATADNAKIVDQFTAPESIQMYKKLRDYYQKGYIAKDAATMQDTAEQMKTGKYFATESSLKPGKDAEMTASTQVDWVQVDLTKPVMSNRETTGALTAIPASSEHPDRAFQFLEMLYTDPTLLNLIDFGVKDTHYTVNSDGRITITQDGKDKYNPGNTWRFGDQFKTLLMDNEDPQKWQKFLAYNNAGRPEISLGFVFDKTPVDTETAACKTVVGNYSNQLYCGAVDVDSTVAKLSKELKDAGVDAILAEMQKQFDAWRAANGK